MIVRVMTGLLALILLVGFGLPPAPAAASVGGCGQSVDLVMVLDDSGSMHRDDDERNDPDNLRITAAHLMLDLLDPDDRVGLVLFSHVLREQSPLQPLHSARADLHRRIDQFRSQGATGLDIALKAALDQLPSTSVRPRAVLLLTDGRPDPDPAGQRLRLFDLARRAREQQVAIYVIGLGPTYDRELLEEITVQSGSEQLWHVTRPEDLSSAFLEILRLLKGLNIETSTAGEVPLLGLSGEVRFAAIRPSDDPPARITWPGGRQVGTVPTGTLSPEVRYGYDLITYEPAQPGPATAATTAPVVWKIERPPAAGRILAPGAREEVAAGEEVEVRLGLSPCGGNSLPTGLKATLTVLDADRRPTPYIAELRSSGDPATLTGQLRMPPDAGTYVLSARILTAEGRQAAVAEQTVTAVPQHRWELEAPPTLANGATGTVTLRHRFGGKPAPADPGDLTANYPGGQASAIALAPGAGPGEWVGRVTAPADQTGQITYDLAGGKATAATLVEPVRFIPEAPPPVRWSFWQGYKGEAVSMNLSGRTTGPVADPGVIPPYTHAQSWAAATEGGFIAAAAIPVDRAPSWTNWRDLFVGRDLTISLVPQPGPYLQAEPVSLQGRVAPLLAWYWLIALLAALLVAGYAVWLRLYDGPQLPIAIGAAGGAPILLMGRRPGLLTRFLNPQTQREIVIGGVESGARVRLPGLPPKALLKVKARGIAGRERFRIESLNPQLPLVQNGLNKRRVSLKGRGPVPGISLGDILLEIHLHPKHRTRR